jgi:hypothetical protein
MKELHVSISRGNTKMGAIPSLSLPPIITCSPYACKLCGKKCYARRITARRKTVKEAYDRNLYLLQNEPEKFWREVGGAMAMSTHFRFGVSGDIVNMDYLEHIVSLTRKYKQCEVLCFTKQFDVVNAYLEHHRLPKNLHLIFSAWKGLDMPNPHNLPEAHVLYRDGTTTARDGAKFCSGNCTECGIEKKDCWTLQKKSQILFREH